MKKRITIEGMSCMHCVNHVKEALEGIGGQNINVSLEKNLATVEFDDVTDQKIIDAITDAGYDVLKIENI